MVQRSRRKELKQQHMNEPENIVLECTTEDVSNCEQKSLRRLNIDATWYSLRSEISNIFS